MPWSPNHPSFFRLLLGVAGVVYLGWWFLVEKLLPESFNPLFGRLLVVGYFLGALLLTSIRASLRRHAETLYYLGAVLLIGHYFYLVHNNTSDLNWVVGAYVVVFALSGGVRSRPWLLVLSALSFTLGIGIWTLDPVLRDTIFLPGLATINVLCLVVLLSRLRLLEELSESAGRFQDLFEAAFEGVAVHDQGTILDVNAAFAALFGYSQQQLIGMSVGELNDPEYRSRVAQQIREVPVSRYESVGLRSDGTRMPIEISTKPHLYRGRRLRLAAVRDLSDSKRVEAERLALLREQTARASAQEAIRLRDEFISVAGHELRTPVTSLQLQHETYVRKWRKDLDPDQAQQDLERYSHRVRRQIARLGDLIEELLDVTQFEAGQLTLRPEKLELTALARDVVDSLTEDLRRASCPVEIRSAAMIEGHWDKLRLEQVLTNLIRNAMIYGAGKAIEIGLRQTADLAIVEVRDHGIGIEKESQGRIFHRYERAVSSSHYGGLGLGLYVARQIVEAHRGTIRVDSTPGQGSTFTIEFPLRAAADQP